MLISFTPDYKRADRIYMCFGLCNEYLRVSFVFVFCGNWRSFPQCGVGPNEPLIYRIITGNTEMNDIKQSNNVNPFYYTLFYFRT